MKHYSLIFLLAAMAGMLPFAGRAESEVGDMLNRYDFIYAGQSKNNRIFTIKGGAVESQLNLNDMKGEISDIMLLAVGNFLLAHQYGVREIGPDGTAVWSYDAPEGTEIHTVQPVGDSLVVFVQNGRPAKAVVMEVPALRIVSEFELPVAEKASVHGQFRNARLTARGTLLVTNMSLDCVSEYNSEGKEIDRWHTPAPWSASETGKGNILVVGRKGYVREINRRGQTLRDYDTRPMGAVSPQKALLLKNGNIIVNSWYNEWSKTPIDTAAAPVQAVEFDRDGNVVATLRSWRSPELGPSTTIQLLDQPVVPKRMFFGKFNPRSPKLFVEPNKPLGKSTGDFPGRVSWVHAPGVAAWDGRTGLWVDDRWNSQELADMMVRETVMSLAGERDVKKAWKALFVNFNKKSGKGSHGYRPGQKIAVKLNMNNAITHRDTIELNSSPFVTLALVRSLVNDGGVAQRDLTICEPSRAITDSIYDKIHREFPDVTFVDNIGGDGRQKCEYYPEMIRYSVDNGKMARGLAKCIVDADYLINSALLKTHSGPGVTLTAKNWYGATDISLLWRQNAHNNISQDKRHGKPGYKTFVDFIAHPHLGGKCMLFLIDGTYGSRDVNGAPAPKWQSEPYGGDWACSLIASQDALAADAVAMDMIIGEWPEFESLNYCDEYLREAATIPHTPSGTVYMRDGKPIVEPLGLMEHPDNHKDWNYKAIDLVYRNIGAPKARAFGGLWPVTDKAAQKSLGGVWKLMVVEGVADGADVPEADSSWGEIPVPGCWEQYGFCKPAYAFPDSLTGFYRTEFTIPADWKGNNVAIRLDGVLRGYHLWLNGSYVGKWEECYNTNVMDLTPYLTKNAFAGEPQRLAMRVYSRYKGFEFDCFDDWAPMGIHRDVSIMKIPHTHFSDITVTTDDKGAVEVAAEIDNATAKTTVEVTLTDADGRVVGEVTSFRVKNPQLWTAETPYLYNLAVLLKDGKKLLQRYDKKIGLRKLEISAGNILMLNGRPLKLRGVTCHATDPRTVKVIGDTLTLKDMRLMKEASVNYIRTSHYPREPRFYELADSMGFYIVDEVPFGSKGRRHLEKEDYYPLLQSRTLSAISRDKNNTCVLIWSLGNENPLPRSCCRLGEYAKSLDPSRPICYPQVGSYFRSYNFNNFPAVADIYAPHYPTTSQLGSFYRNPDRPLIFTEYCHTLGISFEDHDRQWEIIESVPAIAGGSVWEWVDQGMPFAEKLESRFGYEERVFTSDQGGFEMNGNQGTDGLLYANRVPLPNYYELQRNYAVVDVLDSLFTGSLTVRNRHDFANLKDAAISWSLVSDNDTISRGSFTVDCPPHSTAKYAFDTPFKPEGAVNVLALNFTSHQGYDILHRNIPVSIDRKRIFESTVEKCGHAAELQPMLRVGRKPTMCEQLKTQGRRVERYIQPLSNPYVKATLAVDGKKLVGGFEAIPDTVNRLLSEVGVAYLLPPHIDRIQWVGNGPYASYPGRRRSVSYGYWAMHKDDIYFEGNRMGVDAIWLSDSIGNGYVFYCRDGMFDVEQTDKGILLTVNAAVSGEGPKFATTAFGVWSDSFGPTEVEYYVAKTTADCMPGLFPSPGLVPAPFRPFVKQYDTYLMRFDDIVAQQ